MVAKTDDRVTKRKVTGRNLVARTGEDGKPVVVTYEVTDYVRPEELDAYVADMRTRWAEVFVGEEPDAGPGGYEGDTNVPEHIQGKPASFFERYGDATSLPNALDEFLEEREPGVSGNPHYREQRSGGGEPGARAFLPRLAGPALGLLLTLLLLFSFFRSALLAVQTGAMRDILANAYHGSATHGAVYTTAPGASAGTEPTGGTPAYARKALTWAANNGGTATGVFDIPSGSTIVGAGVHSALTAGTYYDGTSVTSQAFNSQGTYTVTFTYTQS